MFKKKGYRFEWKDLGDIQVGRPSLGLKTNVAVYRLMQFSLRDALVRHCGIEEASQLFVDAGELAGSEFCKNVLNTDLGFDEFVADLQSKLKELEIGILRVEEADLENMKFMVTVSDDLDCSGLPVSGETVCDYDEGFIAGILGTYTGEKFDVKEVDCWASGGRVCRFSANSQ